MSSQVDILDQMKATACQNFNIEEAAEKNGYRILLCNSGSDIERSKSGLRLLTGKMVDGIITMDAFTRLPELTTAAIWTSARS